MLWEVYLSVLRPNQPSILGSSSPRHFKSWIKLESASWPSPPGADPGFFEGGAGLAGLLRNLQSQGRSHTPPR